MTHISAYEHELAKHYHDAVQPHSRRPRLGPDFAAGRTRAPTVSITLDKVTAAEAAGALGNQGICVWDGDFYAARAVQVLGLAERGGLLRTGISMYNTRDELNRLLRTAGGDARGAAALHDMGCAVNSTSSSHSSANILRIRGQIEHRNPARGRPMQPSKLTYYADFVVYPPVIVGLAAVGLIHGAWRNRAEWLCAEVAGFVIWTLLEYVLHRSVLHRRPISHPCTASITPRRWRTLERRRG